MHLVYSLLLASYISRFFSQVNVSTADLCFKLQAINVNCMHASAELNPNPFEPPVIMICSNKYASIQKSNRETREKGYSPNTTEHCVSYHETCSRAASN